MYKARHAKPKANQTSTAVVSTTAALVLAVPAVAVAQTSATPPPAPKALVTSQQKVPAVDISDIYQQKALAAKVLVNNQRKEHAKHVPAVRAPSESKRSADEQRAHPRSHRHAHASQPPAYGLRGNLSERQLAALWERAGGNPAHARIAAAIAMAESSGRQYAHSGTADFGYWQINGTWGRLATYDPIGNAKAAIIISHDGSNWSPWTTYTSGAYLRYM